MGLADWQEEGSAVIHGKIGSIGIDPPPQLHGLRRSCILGYWRLAAALHLQTE